MPSWVDSDAPASGRRPSAGRASFLRQNWGYKLLSLGLALLLYLFVRGDLGDRPRLPAPVAPAVAPAP